ncbi:unnamed protein product [Amoebophrya sp. A120]|nr:unnamed protein product [Amoebophrya sp. A120]|eukprot:GSA120T00009069001.1
MEKKQRREQFFSTKKQTAVVEDADSSEEVEQQNSSSRKKTVTKLSNTSPSQVQRKETTKAEDSDSDAGSAPSEGDEDEGRSDAGISNEDLQNEDPDSSYDPDAEELAYLEKMLGLSKGKGQEKLLKEMEEDGFDDDLLSFCDDIVAKGKKGKKKVAGKEETEISTAASSNKRGRSLAELEAEYSKNAKNATTSVAEKKNKKCLLPLEIVQPSAMLSPTVVVPREVMK